MSLSTAAAAALRAAAVSTILSDPGSWDQWFEETRASVPNHLWKFYDPDDDVVFSEPVYPDKPTDLPIPDGVETIAQQAVKKEENRRLQDIYYNDYSIAMSQKKEWDSFNTVFQHCRGQIA